MTQEEITAFVIARWQMDHAPFAIMCQLIVLGAPLKKRDVLDIIRRWCDSQTENLTYRRKV